MLRNLRKLFCSFCGLEELPESLGFCSKLEKVRLVQNRLEVLPFSMLRLWQNKPPGARLAEKKPTPNPGNLEELLLNRNPLKLPSLTSFEMGGLDLGFSMLQEQMDANPQCASSAELWLEMKRELAGAQAQGDLVDEGLQEFLRNEPGTPRRTHAHYRVSSQSLCSVPIPNAQSPFVLFHTSCFWSYT